MQDRIFEEFNTLSVIYGEPAERFVTHERAQVQETRNGDHAMVSSSAVSASPAAPISVTAHEEDEEDEEEDDDEEEDEEDNVPVPPPAPPPPAMDLLGLLDDFGTQAVASSPPAPSISFSPSAAMDAASFQQQWGVLQAVDSWSGPCTAGVAGQLAAKLAARHIKCMAFGTVGDQTKFYFYAQEISSNVLLLVELVIRCACAYRVKCGVLFAATNAVASLYSTSINTATATIKASGQQPVPAFSASLKAECGVP